MPLTWKGETYFTVAEAAPALGVAANTLYASLRSGKLPCVVIRGQKYLRESDLDGIFGRSTIAQPVPLRTTAEHRRAAEAAMKRLEKKGYRRE